MNNQPPQFVAQSPGVSNVNLYGKLAANLKLYVVVPIALIMSLTGIINTILAIYVWSKFVSSDLSNAYSLFTLAGSLFGSIAAGSIIDVCKSSNQIKYF